MSGSPHSSVVHHCLYNDAAAFGAQAPSISSSSVSLALGWITDLKVAATQAVFEVGIAAEQNPQVHKNSLVREFEESLQWWLHTRPEVCNRSHMWPQSSFPSE